MGMGQGMRMGQGVGTTTEASPVSSIHNCLVYGFIQSFVFTILFRLVYFRYVWVIIYSFGGILVDLVEQ